jgi:hypothetical protein
MTDTQPLEPMNKAKRPSTPLPSGHKSTKLRPGVTSLPTPDSRDHTSARKKRASQLELLQTPDVSPCPKRLKDAVLEHKRGLNLFATGLELPRSEGREAGLVINEERPLVIRMGERDYPVPGVDVGQMEAFLYVSGKLHDAFGKGT